MTEQQQDRVWHWIRVVIVVSISLITVLALTAFVLPHMGHGSVTFNESEYDDWGDVENKTTTSGTHTLDGLPADNGTTFMISSGAEAPADWGYPAQVTVEHLESNTTYLTTVYEREKFTLDLEDGETYRFFVEPPNGQRRALGIMEYTDRLDGPVEIVVFQCCHDDFSGGTYD